MARCDTIREYISVLHGVRMSTMSKDIETCESILIKNGEEGPKTKVARRLGAKGDCYNTALVTALSMRNDRDNRDYRGTVRYVEGMAISVIPMWHGWVQHTDGSGGKLIETVWDDPSSEYFGIAWHPEVARDAMIELGWAGILPNLWAANRELGDIMKWLDEKLRLNRQRIREELR